MEKAKYIKKARKNLFGMLFVLMFALISMFAVQVQATENPVELKYSKYYLTKGVSFKMTATVQSTVEDKTLTWTTSDKTIATVTQKGKIKGIKNGTAVITATLSDGSSASCKVKVVTPSKVTLSDTSLTLLKGNTYTLTKTVAPTSAKNAIVSWSSSNKKVATVSSKGKITAVGNGTATITVKTGNGKKATCKVTVTAPTKVTLNKTSLTMTPGQSYTLKATVSPTAAQSFAVTWKSSNKKVAKVSSKGKVKVVGTGTATITVKTVNGKTAKCKITSKSYVKSGSKLYVGTSAGLKTYTLYTQTGKSSYYRNLGCVTTAVSIVASSYGKSYSPETIHASSVTKKYSERYAVKKLGYSTSLFGSAAISVKTASQILTDMGITNKAVYSYDKATAIAEITAHVKQGKPVILKANNSRVNGVQIANAHHAMVLVGIDENGYGIFIEPFNGSINYAHGNGTYFKMTIDTFVNKHMTSATGNYNVPYVTSIAAAGGYILVG